jgi:DNA-binding beta-propeller fold protein YncE
VVATIKVGRAPTAIAITSDGSHAYVSNTRAGTVSVIDTETDHSRPSGHERAHGPVHPSRIPKYAAPEIARAACR